MSAIPLPFTNGFYKSDSLPLAAQECVNLYPVIPQSQALSKRALFGTPGISQLATVSNLPTFANRGSHVVDGVPYHVQGGTLYKHNSDDTQASIGSITGTSRVSMADNGRYLVILVPGSTGYYLDTTTDTLTAITDTDFTTTNGVPQFVLWIDGYFMAGTDDKKFIISSLNDPSTWNGTEFSKAEADPDAIEVLAKLNNQLYVFGTQTIEEYANTNTLDFPFQRTGSFFESGTRSPYSVVTAFQAIFYVGGGNNESAAIWQFNGSGPPQKISTPAIDSILIRLTEAELAAVFSYAYAQKGSYFVAFNLPDTTLVYDLVTELWHERKSRIENPDGTVETKRYRVNSVVNAYGKLIVGDSEDGRIGSMDIDIYAEYGGSIIRTISTQPFSNSGDSFFVPIIELFMESGTGNSDTEDPKVEMSRSMNGRTWTNPRIRSIGKIGEYEKRQIWTKNGRARRFELFRFTTSAKSKIVMIELLADMLPGAK